MPRHSYMHRCPWAAAVVCMALAALVTTGCRRAAQTVSEKPKPTLQPREPGHLDIQLIDEPDVGENCYVVSARDGGPCWIIDPGYAEQVPAIVEYVQEYALEPAAILITHGHLDHLGGVDAVREALSPPDAPLPVYLAREDWAALHDPKVNLSSLADTPVRTSVTDPRDLPAGSTLELDGMVWQVLDSAGHSPGGRSFYCAEAGVVFVGDSLFAGSVGRVDLPGGDGDQLLDNLRTHLMALPDATRVLCGHGRETTIGAERATNEFIRDGF